MAWAKEMGSLVGAIKTSHRERAHFLKESKQTTHQLLADFDAWLKDTARDLKVMFAGVRDMLDKSETARMHDFKAMMEEIHGRIKSIQARVKEVRGDAQNFLVQLDKEMKDLASDLKDFLAKSESARKADFKTVMEEIAARIDVIKKEVAHVRRSARELLGDYKAERKEAAAHWASLPERHTASEEAVGEASEAPQVHAKKKSHK